MPTNFERVLQRANAAFQAGEKQHAERLYKSILRAQPKHADANHNLGLLAISANEAKVALPLFEAAVEANPAVDQFWFSYINALVQVREYGKAGLVIEKAKLGGG